MGLDIHFLGVQIILTKVMSVMSVGT